jgi:hypothetical protein
MLTDVTRASCAGVPNISQIITTSPINKIERSLREAWALYFVAGYSLQPLQSSSLSHTPNQLTLSELAPWSMDSLVDACDLTSVLLVWGPAATRTRFNRQRLR